MKFKCVVEKHMIQESLPVRRLHYEYDCANCKNFIDYDRLFHVSGTVEIGKKTWGSFKENSTELDQCIHCETYYLVNYRVKFEENEKEELYSGNFDIYHLKGVRRKPEIYLNGKPTFTIERK